MKKILCLLLVVCSLLTCLNACGEQVKPEETQPPMFESEGAMMTHLNGIWLVANKAENQEYYIFQNGELFYLDDTAFLSKTTEYLEATLSNEGNEALLNTTFETAINSLTENKFLGDAIKLDNIDTKNGIITFNTVPDGSVCSKISIGENSVTVTDNENFTFTLTQFAPDCTFNHEHFQNIFVAAKQPYQDKIEEQLKKEQLHEKKLYGVLDYSKVWKTAIPNYEDCYMYYGFTKDGKCYFVLSAGYEIVGGGKGTYKVNEDDTLTLSMKSEGESYKETFTFDADKKTLKLKKKGYFTFSKAGAKFKLKKSSDITFSKLKSRGSDWAKGYAGL